MNRVEDKLSIANLFAYYNGKPVLYGVNLTLQEGEICSVIGEEGAGKSTLLKAITQQIKTTGEISYNKINLTKLSTAEMVRHKIDFITQGGNILIGFTVEEHICLALAGKGASEKAIAWMEIEKAFPKLIALKKQVAGRLSGGERMILSMACVIATNADFLVLDEPTAGLASETCEVIRDFLEALKGRRDKTILVLEHNYEFAFEIADSVVILKEGILSNKYFPDAFRQKDFVEVKLYEESKILV